MNLPICRRAFTLAMCVAALLAGGSVALAHEGHLHKVMGTIVASDAAKLDVKGTDGKTLTLLVDGSTKVTRGTAIIHAADLKTGDRVVAAYMPMKGPKGAEMLMAKDVKAAAPASAAPAKQP
jgi:hypothetical protein